MITTANLSDAQWSACQRYLISQAASHYEAWSLTKPGRAYLASKKRGKSPHRAGYSQPDWMHAMREAMGRGDAEAALGIMGEVRAGNGACIQ